MPQLTVLGRTLEHRRIEAAHADAPTLVFLHEGLGSAGLWRDFPDRLASATGCGALVYSRLGYGRSGPHEGPRGIDYMHVEALEVLPAVLAACAIDRPILVGHSDGASIALIHAGTGHAVRALILEAPHVFVEDITIAGIAAAKQAWGSSDLPARLARHHDDAGRTFRGWNDIWLDPAFRSWTIEPFLPAITCPMLLIQGEDDEYGTFAQLDAIAAAVRGSVDQLRLPACRHTPHRDQPEATLAAMARFVGAMAV
jgi:pimeloyl-ACP methyl ester carboxylesterase